MDEPTRTAWLAIGSRILRASPERFGRVLEGLTELAAILESIRAIDWRLGLGAGAGSRDRA